MPAKKFFLILGLIILFWVGMIVAITGNLGYPAENSGGFTEIDHDDTTPPTTPIVTYQGGYCPDITSITLAWTSSDSESGIEEYAYQIREGSPTGNVRNPWTSVGNTTGLRLEEMSWFEKDKTYYFGIKAKNKVGLWSNVGFTDGITCDHLKYIDWAGYRWSIQNNYESGTLVYDASVWVDTQGRLHLKYTNQTPTGRWTEVLMVTPSAGDGKEYWGYGDYIWRIEDSSLDFIDPRMNFALWLFDNTVPPGYNEMDFEMIHWNPNGPNGSTTVHNGGTLQNYFPFYDTTSTLTIQWHPDRVQFIAESEEDGRMVWGTSEPLHLATPSETQLWMGLMMWKKTVPSDGKPVEVIIKDFQFIPYGTDSG
jgi:hypothetical protein